MAETVTKRKLPPITDYQTRCTEGASGALKRGEDVLIEAPTGAGKTPMIARLAGRTAREGRRALILTHRKLLFSQMVGRADADTEKRREGEIAYWGGVTPGTIADNTLGGVAQDSPVVVAMVETAASRIDQLSNYDVIFIDETQHVSEASASSDIAGAYSKVIEALPNAKLAGLTATTFRGDGDRLHPRLEAAHREVVGIDEARNAGRIVPARTIIGKARTESGHTAADLVQLEAEGRLDRSASAVLRDGMGDAFYGQAVEDWEGLLKRRKTIVFVDSVEEVRDMTRRFNERYGEGVAVCLHGGKNPDGRSRTARQNGEALMEYEGGSARVLLSCQMIGEGFDVPDTDAVMSLNASLSRLEMNQYVGRCVRSSPDKEYGFYVDYGTASHKHGLIEHQHEMQNIDALAAAGTRVSAARVIGRMAPVRQGAWRAVPGERESLFLREAGERFEVYHFDHKAEKTAGRRVSKNAGSVTNFSRLDHPLFGTKALGVAEVGRVLADHAKSEAAYYARMGGVGSETYKDTSRDMLDHWSASMDKVDETKARYAQPTEGGTARMAALESALAEDPFGPVRLKALEKALSEAKNGSETVRACLDLSSVVLSKCAARPDIPFGVAAEARSVMESLGADDFSEMRPGAMRKEAIATASVMQHLRKNVTDPTLIKVIGSVADPLQAGITKMTQEMAAAQRRKQAQRT